MRFFLVVKSRFHASCEQIFAYTKLRVSKFSVFRQSENSIVAESLNQRFKVLHKEWGYSSFLKPENVILPSREILVQRYNVS